MFYTLFLITVSVTFSSGINLDEIISECVAESEQFAQTEKKYVSKEPPSRVLPIPVAPAHSEFSPLAYEKEKRQRPFECITARTSRISRIEVESNLKYQDLVSRCKRNQSQPVCEKSYPYRSFDGTCNNLWNPKFGSLLTCLGRIMDANYQDAAGWRQSVCGSELPPPREVSLSLHKDVNKPSQDLSHMGAFFSQFVTHDIVDTAIFTVDDKYIDCCSNPRRADKHPQCAEILVQNDPYFSELKDGCINIFRATVCDTCTVGKRFQISQATSFIDLSIIYGNSVASSKKLRSNDGSGTLKMQKTRESGDLLQPLQNPTCGHVEKGEFCFESGDRRGNVHTPLITLFTLFAREHNRIASQLKFFNRHYDEEKLFQEARKINIAQYQFIVFNELLPLLLGNKMMKQHGLLVLNEGASRYDPSVDATILTEFSGAGFRLHTLISAIVTNYEVYEGKRLFRNMSIEPAPLYHNALSPLMEGMCLTPAQQFNRFFTAELSKFLYKTPDGDQGFDIATFNILRGRDMGLPTYVDFVHTFYRGKYKIQSFEDLKVFMDSENIKELQKVYCDVRDVDLWVGMLNEGVPEGSVVGPTAGQVIANQMKRLKYGDRFYFEHAKNFNEEQLQSIKRASLAGVLCSNTNIRTTQLQSMRIPSAKYPLRLHLCEDIPKIDLSLWKEY